MTGTAVPYGAVELKQAEQKYWLTGFLISFLVHALVVGGLRFGWFQDTGQRSGRGAVTADHPVTFIPLPPPLEPPGVMRADRHAARVHAARATPVPVPNAAADPENTIPGQHDYPADPEPSGSADGGYGVDGENPQVTVPDDAEPPIFLAVEKYPVLIKRITPEYPPLAVKAGIEGKVVVRMLVDKEGNVRKAVVDMSTADILNDAAVAAALRFRFIPAYTGGGPVSVWVTVPFAFKLAGK